MSDSPEEKKIVSLFSDWDVEYKLPKDMTLPPKNLFSLLVNRIKKTFQPSSKSDDLKLSGRVQQLNQTANTVLQKLKDIKSLLQETVDPTLFAYVETLMDPMTREVVFVQKLLSNQGSVVQQAKVFKKYSNWMIKAELWMDLEKQAHDMQAINKTIILHIMHEADEQIDQDLQVIRDYEEHILDTLPLNEDEAAELKKHLNKEIRPQLLNLEDLKDKPELHNLPEVFAWKDDLDKKRSKFFDRALQVIDEVIYAISPSSSSEEEHDHLIEVLSQIVFLEEEIPALIPEINNQNILDPVRKALILSKIESFQQELHELNLNLRLTPELVDRLQSLIQQLNDISQNIDVDAH